ncbi:MAG TPA: hypothetical protein VKI00_03480 [Mycobacterium sp.]|uniref:hypothetical protein n=1 Tax=Mycobacterium sp. TaxID=1785 RepID=UPI002C15FB8E|nr:hypothetical protein [Mycobacterium sp.]HME74731.1 hypothetical protein [Mycobacterium sp.]
MTRGRHWIIDGENFRFDEFDGGSTTWVPAVAYKVNGPDVVRARIPPPANSSDQFTVTSPGTATR